jgi:hypothetical protein
MQCEGTSWYKKGGRGQDSIRDLEYRVVENYASKVAGSVEALKVMTLYRQRQKVAPHVAKVVTCVLVCATYTGCKLGYYL